MKINFKHSINYPVFKYAGWSQTLGSVLIILITLQIFTGILLALRYVPAEQSAAYSIWFIETHIHYGWLMRQWHVVGNSLLFIALYSHMVRGCHFRLFEWHSRKVWWTGCFIYITIMAIAFLGYILPWGQLSYWGAKVIISMTSSLPFIGTWLTTYLWGGLVPATTMLSRILWLHILLPFFLVGIVAYHILTIHSKGAQAGPASSQVSYNIYELSIDPLQDSSYQRFCPEYWIKDVIMVMNILIIGLCIIWIDPYFFSDSINAISPEPGVAPKHIKPEWYFYFFLPDN